LGQSSVDVFSLLKKSDVSEKEVVEGLEAFLGVSGQSEDVCQLIDVDHVLRVSMRFEEQLLDHAHALEHIRVLSVD